MPFLTKGKTNWKYILIVVILTVIVGGVVLGYVSYSKREMVSITKFSEIKKPEKVIEKTKKLTLEILENAEYYSYYTGKRIKLTNGEYYVPPPDPTWATGYWYVGIWEGVWEQKGKIIAFGDLNDDGKEDAAVILDSHGGGSGHFYELAVVINQDGNPYNITTKGLGDRVKIHSMEIKKGEVVVDMTVHGPGDPLCCPTLRKIFRYRLSGNKLLEVTELETADWKWYSNVKYYQIKYPKNWSVHEFSVEFVSFTPSGKVPTIEYPGEIIIKVYPYLTDLPNNEKGLEFNDWLEQQINAGYFKNKKETVVGIIGVESYKGVEVQELGTVNYRTILIPNSPFHPAISFSIREDSGEMSIFDLMLTTFLFGVG
jgi:hypothetical protein